MDKSSLMEACVNFNAKLGCHFQHNEFEFDFVKIIRLNLNQNHPSIRSFLNLEMATMNAIDFMISTLHWMHMSVTQKEITFMAVMCHSILGFYLSNEFYNWRFHNIFAENFQLYCKCHQISTLFKWVLQWICVYLN